jgi:curli biogenesis system outer membrane secretion channel CsgG
MKFRHVATIGPMTACLALIASLALAQPGQQPWKPFVQDKHGKAWGFPDRPEQLKDKDWLLVRYTEYAGARPRVGVVLSDEKFASPNPYHSDWARLLSDVYGRPASGTDPFNHVEDVMRQALGATNRFTMVERTTALADVTKEQDFDASGRVEAKTAAPIGKIKGAEYILKATLIEINPNKDAHSIGAIAGGMGARTLGIGSIGLSGKVAFCRINARLINATTGEIAQDLTADGTASSSGVTVGAGLIKAASGGVYSGGGGIDTHKAAILANAIQACANKIAYYTAIKLGDLPWQGAVANVEGSKVMINGGTNVGLKVGETLTLMSKGQPVVDPDDPDNVLGYETRRIGALRVVEVDERFSTCEIIEGGQGVKRGDVVRLSGELTSQR